MNELKTIRNWGMNFPDSCPVIISGPCSAETESQTVASCVGAANGGAHLLRAGIWKPRTSPQSFEGIGEQALIWLKKAKEITGLPTTVEVANAHHVKIALSHNVDVLWIGARTTVNPFAVQEIADALQWHDIPVLIKNPINPDIKLWIGAVKRLYNAGLRRIAVIHRGFHTLTQKQVYRNPPNWDLVEAFRKTIPGISIICDPSHLGGKRNLLWSISKKALDLKMDGLMIETHFNPDQALSDAQQQVTPEAFKKLIDSLLVSKTSSNGSCDPQELDNWRHKIDILDQSLLELLAQRREIVGKIAVLKQQHQLSILQLERWKNMLNQRVQQSKGLGLNTQFVENLFHTIHQDSVLLQQLKSNNPPS